MKKSARALHKDESQLPFIYYDRASRTALPIDEHICERRVLHTCRGEGLGLHVLDCVDYLVILINKMVMKDSYMMALLFKDYGYKYTCIM